MWIDFMAAGQPSVQFVYSCPHDGIWVHVPQLDAPVEQGLTVVVHSPCSSEAQSKARAERESERERECV